MSAQTPSVLPVRPSLFLLSDRAKALRKAHAAGDPPALQRIALHHPAFAGADPAQLAAAKLSLRDAQLVVAREHGFDNWTGLKRHVEARQLDADAAPVHIETAVPFFAVADMTASLAHYVDRLGYRITRTWEKPEGTIAWCWLDHGGGAPGDWPGGRGRASLMLQQYRTEGHNARTYEGVRGVGTAFVVTTAAAATGPARGDAATWPFGDCEPIVDGDGYTLRARPGTLGPDTEPLSQTVPVRSVTNLTQSLAHYTEGLGFVEVDRLSGPDGVRACRLQRGGAVVVLQQETGAAPARRGQGVSTYHLCADAVALYRELRGRGVNADEPFVGNRLWCVGVSDPDGYVSTFESPADAPEEATLSEVDSREESQR